jgi:exo-1,4-beta-D-glucosaminidase
MNRSGSIPLGFLLTLALAGAPASAPAADQAQEPPALHLRDGWALQSSCTVKAGGEAISTAGFKTDGWHKAQVPTTVVAALVADGTYGDPFVGNNLRSFPGMTYAIGHNFSREPMSPESPFRCSWWYRTEFRAPAKAGAKASWLRFDGINYRASVWLNGQKVADAADMVGTFRAFEYDVTRLVHASGPNVLAVEVQAPQEQDLAITWVDWNPSPPDKNMGIWKDVWLRTSGDVTLRDPFVSTQLGIANVSAALTVSADLHNTSTKPVKGTLTVEIEKVRASEPVELQPGETKTVRLQPEQHRELILRLPRVWWPHDMGKPELYTAQLTFTTDVGVSDAAHVRFGVREVTADPSPEGHRLFKINGRPILIRGGGWSSDMLLRYSQERAQAELTYVKDMGLNTVRQEGKLEPDAFYDLADEMGVLLMPGWCCCDFWERWGQWKPEHYKIAEASMVDQARRLRNHPSVIVWLYGSDNPPNAQAEEIYLRVLKEQRWPNPSFSSASGKPAPVSGASGVKMTGPYDYVPPNYWLVDTQLGGAHGFNTETSPGPAIPPLSSLKRFLPKDHLWPIDDTWYYHCGGNRFTSLEAFRTGLDARYGKPEALPDFLRKSEAMAYEGQRAMFEAYGRNKYVATGVIQWMLNNAWPSLIWHLYDWYLLPAGGYFGTKKACEPVHVQYSYDDGTVVVVNGHDQPLHQLKVSAKVYDLDGAEKDSREVSLDVPADASARAFELPRPKGLAGAYFARLILRDASDRPLSDNFYWLSTKRDELAWEQTKGTAYTPQSAWADLTGLNRLAPVELTVDPKVEREGARERVRVRLRNPGSGVAFLVWLRVTKGKDGEDVTPILWNDNYVSLLPGETREISASYEAAARGSAPAAVAVEGWNVAATSIPAGAP